MEIRSLVDLKLDDLRRVAGGYTSAFRYEVMHSEMDDLVEFSLRCVPLRNPYVKTFGFGDETIASYRPFFNNGFSYGAYDNDRLIGLAVCEWHIWNNSVQIHEFHIEESYRRCGRGEALMRYISKAAAAASTRITVCETQNTNVPALKFYHQAGFRIEGIDLSLYSNVDYPDREIAVFMKLRLS